MASRRHEFILHICRNVYPSLACSAHRPLPSFSIHLEHPLAPSTSSSSNFGAMAIGKQADAVLDGGHATQGFTAICCKKRRIPIGSTADYGDPSCLGEGGFGCAVKARHCVTGKNVAIKFLRSPDDTEEPTNVGELYREARFLDAYRGNPYIVGFHGLLRNPTTGDLGLSMEYVDGPSLEAFLHGRTPLPEATNRSFMLQLFTGAKKMQEHKIVHRDIKPANVLVAEGGKLKICDLGLAISMSEPTPYIQAGTLFYMAPEMLLGKPDYGTLVDSWSIGCVMAELVTGKALFRQNDDENHIRQLWTIFYVLGVPDNGTWPEFTSLPFAATVPLSLLEPHSRLRELFPEEMLSRDGFEVLEGLLTCNPDKRLTAAAALELPWFAATKVDPLASPREEVAAALPEKKKLRVKIIPPATPKKEIEVAAALPTKKVLRIKIIPPATPKKEIEVAAALPTKKVLRIKNKPPKKKKNVLKIPLTLWKEAQRL